MSQRSFRSILFLSLFFPATDALASGFSSMPWDSLLMRIYYSCTGPLAMCLGTIAIVLTGIGVAYSEGGSMMRKCLNVVFGLSIAFTATSTMSSFFGFTGGVGF